jgi:hypothetical protein
MKPSIRLLNLAVAAMLPLSVLALGNVANASATPTLASSSPIPVQAALSIVQSARGAGPLTVNSSGGSTLGGVWSNSASTGEGNEATQHWSFEASDAQGSVVLGISVFSNGTEAVSGWVPGTSNVTNWIFNSSNATPSATYQVTVPGTVEEATATAPTKSAISSAGAQRSPSPNTTEICNGIETSPYTYEGDIWYGASVTCNVAASLVDTVTLWDYWDSSTYYNVADSGSAGVEVDYPSGAFLCSSGDSARNSWHTYLLSSITWPPGSDPATGGMYGNSISEALPCVY